VTTPESLEIQFPTLSLSSRRSISNSGIIKIFLTTLLDMNMSQILFLVDRAFAALLLFVF